MEARKADRVARRLRIGWGLLWRGVNHLLWPPLCVNCGESIFEAGNRLCTKCWRDLMTCTAGDYCPRCGRDASPFGMVAGACAACRQQQFHFDGIARAGVYMNAMQWIVLGFKHDRTDLASVLAPLADAELQGSPFYADIELFVPVPLHWTRRQFRGYNQSHLLARRLTHPRARISTDLVRIRRTKIQPAAATPPARARNVAGAFAVREDHRFAGKTICLVDDIKTTGATLSECARTLKEAGTAKVYALVLAVAGQKRP